MAVQTFGEVWRRVALYVPGAPVSLPQEWVQAAYDELCGSRHWVWLKRSTLLQTRASRTVSITFTNGSTAITSAAGFVLATDPGRQVRVPYGPIYTLDTLSTTSAGVLTQAYQGASGAATATILDAYLAMPADFRSIYTVTDQVNQRPIAWWISGDRLNLYDPARISSDGRFRVMAAASTSQATSLLGRIQYELWPLPSAAGTYPMDYFIRSDRLADDDLFQGVLATQTRVLEIGARAEAAKWPGTAVQKNPYFNLALATQLRTDFELAKQNLQVQDDDQYLMSLQQVDLSTFGLAALSGDATALRASDATTADYY